MSSERGAHINTYIHFIHNFPLLHIFFHDDDLKCSIKSASFGFHSCKGMATKRSSKASPFTSAVAVIMSHLLTCVNVTLRVCGSANYFSFHSPLMLLPHHRSSQICVHHPPLLLTKSHTTHSHWGNDDTFYIFLFYRRRVVDIRPHTHTCTY